MTEEVVLNTETDDKEARLICNWCQTGFDYFEKADDYHNHTTCPWCKEKITVPRQRIRRARPK